MRVAIVSNGDIKDYGYLKKSLKPFSYIIGVDGGLVHLDKVQVKPNVLIGDFDSCPKNLLEKYKHIKTLKYPSDKDQTDLELALEHCSLQNVSDMTLFAAHGKRIDHLLGNIFAISKYHDKATIETETESLSFIHKNKTLKVYKGQTLSLIPICGPCKNIVTRGLKWELNHQDLDQSFVGISNVALAESISIQLSSGLLLYILQK